MTLIAIDLGDKICGTAIELEWIALPKDIVPRKELLSYLQYFHSITPITTFIVWLPYDLYGKDLRQLEKTKKFIQLLQATFPLIPVQGVDERFSSFEAEYGLSGIQKRTKRSDDISAAIILESYINQKKNKKEKL